MSDDICPRHSGRQQKRRDGRSVHLPDWVKNKIKRQHIIALTWVTKKVNLVGEISERRPKSEPLFLLGSFVFVGLISTREAEREGGGRY